MSPRLRARLLFDVDDHVEKRGRAVLPIAIVVSILTHIPAVPVLARISPKTPRQKTVHLELLMESVSRRIGPAVSAESQPVGSSASRHERSAIGEPAALVGAPLSKSPMRLDGLLSLQEKMPSAPIARTACKTSPAKGTGCLSKKWFAWYCRRLRQDIGDSYPFELLAKRGIEGEIKFRIELYPDGRVQRLVILESDHPMMRAALAIAMKRASPLPGYSELGLDWFPPLNMSIAH